MNDPIVGASYKHYKNGKEYVVLSLGRCTDDLVPVVIYQAQYDDPEFGSKSIWVRTVSEFVAMVDKDGMSLARFALIVQ